MNEYDKGLVKRLQAAMSKGYDISIEYSSIEPVTVVIKTQAGRETFSLVDLLDVMQHIDIGGDTHD